MLVSFMLVATILTSFLKLIYVEFSFLFFFFFKYVGHLKRLHWICYNIASIFMFWFFGPQACRILVPWPGIEPVPPELEGEVSTTGPPRKSWV